MPNIGGKIWFTAIAGLLLGFVMFGMLQRGCDASGEATIVATDDRPEPPSRNFSANRNNAKTYEPSANSNRNSNARSNNGRRSGRDRFTNNRRTGSDRTPTANRRSSIERSAAARSRADAARKAELARLTRERTQKYRDRARRFSADDPSVIDPAIRASTTGAGIEDAVALAAAETGAELRGLRGEGGSGSGSGSGGDVGGSGGGGGGDGDGGPGDDGGAGDEFSEIADLLADLGIDQSFIDLIQQVVTGATPPVNPFDPGNSTGGDDDDDDNSGPVIPIDPDDVIDVSTPVIAKWAPIDTSDCGSIANQGLATRDLYIAFLNQPIAPPVLSSKGENTLRIVDGGFYQTPLGTNVPPVISEDQCQRFDSYLTIGKAAPVFLSAPDPADWGEQLLAEWFVLGGAQIVQDADAFGDDRYYIHVGRFTAEEGAKVFGKLRVDYAGQLAIVNVPDWMGADIDDLIDVTPPVLPNVISVSVSTTGVLAGAVLQGTVSIDRPAPTGGARIALATNKPNRVLLPSFLRIPEGSQTVTFDVQTIANGIAEDVTITASNASSQRSTNLRLDAPTLDRFRALRTSLLNGQSTSATINLMFPAGEGGVTIQLITSVQGAVEIPTSVRIPAGQFRTVFPILALDVDATTPVTIRASHGGVSRDLSMEIIPTVTVVDANGDGVVDTADLGMLIASFGTANPRFDFNGDGVVDTADLGLLNANFGQTHVPDGDGPGGNEGPGDDDAVIARWIDVPQDDCDEFPGSRTAALFLGFKESGVLPVVSSDNQNGLVVTNGEFIQHQFGSNAPPNDALQQSFPCTAYDSFLSIGKAPGVILGILDPIDWGTRLIASWFSIEGTEEQDAFKFGDNRYYVRVGQFTAPTTASLAGSLRVDYAGELAVVEVPDWSTTAAVALDLNFDGQVDSTDVAMVTRAYGTANAAYDFDGDGIVDGDDLRPLLEAIQNGPGS